MTSQDCPVYFQFVEEEANVLSECLNVVAGFGMVRFAMTTAGEGKNMELVGEAWGEVIEDVGVASHARQEEENRTIAAPIKVMQADTVDFDYVAFVW
jgi:hypothetical protein